MVLIAATLLPAQLQHGSTSLAIYTIAWMDDNHMYASFPCCACVQVHIQACLPDCHR